MNKKSFAVFILILSLILSFGLFFFKDYLEDLQSLGLLGIFLINFFSSATFFVSGPAFLTVIAGGVIYPPLLVALVSSLGASFGDMVAFFFGHSGRHLALSNLRQKIWFSLFEDLFRAYETIIILVFAIIPNPFFDAVGLFAGIFGMNYFKFFIIMFTGRFARFILLAFFGASFN
jgi:membrane protein YqaA with SNARE-associated domain